MDGTVLNDCGGAYSFGGSTRFQGRPRCFITAVSKVGTDLKLVHWTYTGGAGTHPNYDYNNSVSNAGASAANTVLTHHGPIGGGTIGQTAGLTVSVARVVRASVATRGRCLATHADGSPPITTPLFLSVGAQCFAVVHQSRHSYRVHQQSRYIATGSSGLTPSSRYATATVRVSTNRSTTPIDR